MDLIERYVAAVGRHLPAKEAGDIQTELRDVLLNRVEEKEAELGRSLERKDIEVLLLEFGHPLVVAARYRKVQYLIGPEVYPFWQTTIQWSVIILGIVYVTLAAMAVLMRRTNVEILHIGSGVVSIGINLSLAITVVFATFERAGKASFLRDWKPSRLPPPDRGTRPRAAIVAEILVDLGFIVWWQGLIRFQDFFPYPVHLSVALAPVWAAWHWPILAYAVFGIAADIVALARPDWERANVGLRVGRYLYGVAILIGVFLAGHWVDVSSPMLPPGVMSVAPKVLSIIQTNFDLGMRVGIGCAILGMLLQVGLDLRRANRRQGALGPAPRPRF